MDITGHHGGQAPTPPTLSPSTLAPPPSTPDRSVSERLVAFSEAVSKRAEPDKRAWVHFYEDDYKFARFWASPEKYFDRLAANGGVISPDYSLSEHADGQQIGHTYQNQLLGAWLQAADIDVIANVRLSGEASIPLCACGHPAALNSRDRPQRLHEGQGDRKHVIEEIKMVCDFCRPTALVVYGSEEYGVLDYPLAAGVAVHAPLNKTDADVPARVAETAAPWSQRPTATCGSLTSIPVEDCVRPAHVTAQQL